MPSKKCLLPKQFGTLSKLSPQRLSEIKIAASALIIAYKNGDVEAWSSITNSANKTLTRYERGVFSGFIVSGVENGK